MSAPKVVEASRPSLLRIFFPPSRSVHNHNTRRNGEKKKRPSFETALAVVVKVLLGPPCILSHPVQFPFLFISHSCETLGRNFPAALISILRSSGTQKLGFPSATHKWA